jgi:protein ImuA
MADSAHAPGPAPAVARLRERIEALERRGAGRGPVARPAGNAPPWESLAPGALHEIVGASGDGAPYGFAAAVLAATAHERPVLWCRLTGDRGESGLPYGPGLRRFGLDPERLIVVEARGAKELLWAMEEGLRCPGLAATVGDLPSPAEAGFAKAGAAAGSVAGRRLQLAAEKGGGLGLLLCARGTAVSAVTRWRVAAAPAGADGRPAFDVALARARHGGRGRWRLEWDDAALRFHMAALLADGPALTASA